MKRLLLIVLPLLLIVGCSKEPINYETTLIERDVNKVFNGNKPRLISGVFCRMIPPQEKMNFVP
jgi:uncharacterized protein YcfL